MVEQSLTPEERRALGMAALTTLVTALVGGAVAWCFEEAKRAVNLRRERERAKDETPPPAG